MVMKLRKDTRAVLNTIQPIAEPVLVCIILIIAATSSDHIVSRPAIQGTRDWKKSPSGGLVFVYTCLLPFFAVLPSGPMGTAGRQHWGRRPYMVLQSFITPMIMYTVLFLTHTGGEKGNMILPVWAWAFIVLGSAVFGSMDAFEDAKESEEQKSKSQQMRPWGTEMTWGMLSVIVGLCLARAGNQSECFWIRIGIGVVLGVWEVWFGGRHGGLYFLQSVDHVVGGGNHGQIGTKCGRNGIFHGITVVDFRGGRGSM